MNGTGNRPYKLREGALDPLSRKDWWQLRENPQQDPILMRSQETGRMIVDLQRYCRGEKEGVSMLVAGPRGAGKTTLVKLAIRELIVESSQRERKRLTEQDPRESGHLIPLPVLLHGPTILDHEAEAGGPRPRFSEEAPPEEAAEIVKKRAVQLIITELYRELCRVFYDAWCYAAQEAPTARRRLHELLELRTHLDLGLDWAPQPSWLRSIWARAGFLHSGVAFYLVPGLRRGTEGRGRWLRAIMPPQIAGPEEDQGLREIRAITACADAYRVIIAEMKEKIERTSSDETKQQSSSFPSPQTTQSDKPSEKGTDDKSKSTTTKLAPPALGTLAGGLTLFSQDLESVLFAAIAGGAVWLLSWLAMFYNVQRRSSLETRRTQTVDIKWDVPRIERDFPKLLARVKDAGFAPIFVLDELDKTENAKKKLERFLRLTKHFVTGEAAFIFLTNRDYYETLFREQYENRLSETFFTYRIFVRYEADDYRHFLLESFDRAETALEADDARDRYRLGLAAWATILAYRTNMLPYHLNRQLMLLLNEKGEFRHQDPDLPLSATAYRQQVTMQLGIEAVLRDAAVQERLQDSPYAQQIYDSLYYIRELHETGRTHHSLDRESLKEHLWRRAEGQVGDPMPPEFLPEQEIDFLFGLVERYIGLLKRPRRIKEMTTKYAQPRPEDYTNKRTLLMKRLVRGLANAIDERPLVT